MTVLITWNMQGATTEKESIWSTILPGYFRTYGDNTILILQECGNPPNSAIEDPPDQSGYFKRYTWKFKTGDPFWISHFYWGERCNLAIVSKTVPQRMDFVYGTPEWRPAIGVRINSVWFWSVHCISGGGVDADSVLAAIGDKTPGVLKYVLGDFNRNPMLVNGWHVHAAGLTHSVSNLLNCYDYMYVNAPRPLDKLVGSMVVDTRYSDHYPVKFDIIFNI